MAISSNATIEFVGTQDEVTTSPATVTDGSFSVASDTSEWSNDDDAPWAYFVLQLTAAGLSGAPTAGTTIDLYTSLKEIQAVADDQLDTQADFEHYYLGSFPIENQDTDQNIAIGPIRLPNVMAQSGTTQKHQFHIKNNSGVALGTTWQLWVTPATFGPHA